MHFRAYHLPELETSRPTDVLRCGGIEVEVPRLNPAVLGAALARARQRAAQSLRIRSVSDLLATLDRVIAQWLRPDSPLRQEAETLLPAATGFSAPMVKHGLPLLLAPLRADSIRNLLNLELGDFRVLDQTGDRRAAGPSLVAHVMAGNIPGLAAVPMLLSLALKSAVLIKSAAGDPIFPVLFARSIAQVDAELGACVLVTYWRGGDQELEATALGTADLVIASGSDAAVTALAGRAGGRFIGHGHKVSFAAIGAEVLRDVPASADLARRLAYDICVWDQQGCLSPQICYVEAGAGVSPKAFAGQLAQALSDYATALPPRQLSFDEQAAVLRFRQQAEWDQTQTLALVVSPGTTDWSISVEQGARFVPTCLNRCVRVQVVNDLSELPPVLRPHRRHLEAAGLAVGASRAREVSAMLADCGVHRICPIGTMQLPPLSWQQGGRPRVADWVEWTTVEKERGE